MGVGFVAATAAVVVTHAAISIVRDRFKPEPIKAAAAPVKAAPPPAKGPPV
jgi:hypothetical protein